MKQRAGSGASEAHYCAVVASPVGDLLLVADDSALIGLYFLGREHVPVPSGQWQRNDEHPILLKTTKELQDYFAGKRQSFSVPLRLEGTDFQKRVWQEIARIPYGHTVTYSELALRAGAPEAVRAAGTATGRNPLSIIVPCHRVMGKNGTLCGFAGGLDNKRYLLVLEKPRG